jgi:hypothetical protein
MYGAALALVLGFLGCTAAEAGPYFGEWGWWYHPCDCPRGDYCPLHYWAMRIYRVRAFCSPSYLDQYPPGPYPPVPPTFETAKYRCPPVPPMPSSPYADPAGYYGRSLSGQIDSGLDLSLFPVAPATTTAQPQ